MRALLAALILLCGIGRALAFPDVGGYLYPSLVSTCSPVCDGARFNVTLTPTSSVSGDPLIWVGITGSTGTLAQTGYESPGAGAAPRIWYEVCCLQGIQNYTGVGTVAWGDTIQFTVLCTANCTAGGSQTWAFTAQDLTAGHTWTATATVTLGANQLSNAEWGVELNPAAGANSVWTGPIRISNAQVHQGGAWVDVNLTTNPKKQSNAFHAGSNPYAVTWPSAAFGPHQSDFSLCVNVQSSTQPSATQTCPYTAISGGSVFGP